MNGTGGRDRPIGPSRRPAPTWALVLGVALAAVTFAVDLAMPRDVAAPLVAYLLPILLSVWLTWPRAAVLLAALATALVLAGFLLRAGDHSGLLPVDRIAVVAVLWLATLPAFRRPAAAPAYRGAVGDELGCAERAGAAGEGPREIERRLEQAGTPPPLSRQGAEIGPLSPQLAHELSQPLTAALNYIQAGQQLLDGVAPDARGEVAGLMDKATGQIHRAGAIVRNARAANGSCERTRSIVSINDVVVQACDLVRPELADRRIALSTRLEDGLPAISIDRDQIAQLLLMLIRRRAAAMATDELGALSVATSRSEGGAEVVVAVGEGGPGLRERIGPAPPGPAAPTERGAEASGLASVGAMLEAHGGRFWIRPGVEGGTTFLFALPFHRGTNR